MKEKILVIEDENSIAELLQSYLKNEDYQVQLSNEGFDGIRIFNDWEPHLVILDRMLPDISGDQVCEEIRKVSSLPIMMLTAKSDESSRIEGFEMGVDDYVTKPFSAREVLYRVKALMARSYPDGTSKIYDDGYLAIDHERRQVAIQGVEVHLTANEYDLLEALYDASPRPLSRNQIVQQVFGHGYEAFDRNIDTYIKNIRHKIEVNPKEPVYVCTKYGVGYYFGKEA